MPLRIDKTVNTFITADTAQEDRRFGNLDPVKRRQRIDTMQRYASGEIYIAGGGTQAISFGDVDSVRYVEVVADRDFNALFNGFADALPIRLADSASGRRATLSLDILATSLSITNADATNALMGYYVVYGDPVS